MKQKNIEIIFSRGIILDKILDFLFDDTLTFSGDTLICLSNGISKRINYFSNPCSSEKIWYYSNDCFVILNSIGLLYDNINETFKLTLIDGRTITTMSDHKFKVNINNNIIFKKAHELTFDDKLLISPIGTEDINYNDENNWSLDLDENYWILNFDENDCDPSICGNYRYYFSYNNETCWKMTSDGKYWLDIDIDPYINKLSFNDLEVIKYKFNMKDNLNRKKSLAFARLLGECTDDYYCRKNIYFSKMIDGDNILDDIELITNERPIIIDDENNFYIKIPDTFWKFITKMLHILDFKNIPLKIFLLSCPKSIIREYLATLLCKNTTLTFDFYIRYYIEDGDVYSYSGSEIEHEYLKESNYIKELLNKLNIETTDILSGVHYQGKNIRYEDDYEDYRKLYVSFSIISYEKFRKNIGFRYCMDKTLRLEVICAYTNFCEQNNNIKLSNEFINDYGCTWFHKEQICHKYDKYIPYYYLTLIKKEICNKEKLYKIGLIKY